MNSLEALKNELLKQKQLLISKGIGVTTVGNNPSPTDITNAIDNMTVDFSSTTATTDDVRAGKTFYSQNDELKTGTLDTSGVDVIQDKLDVMITGIGSMEVKIPEDATQIREYAFYVGDFTNENAFYKENLVIPASVKQVGAYAFKNCPISGKLIVPSTCKTLKDHAFSGTSATEIEINGGITSSPMYIFAYSYSVKKIVVNQQVSTLPTYIFYRCLYLEELYLPPTLTSFPSNSINACTAIKLIEFSGETPPTFESSTFSKCPTASLIVPYLSYDAYLNQTNFTAKGNPVYGFGNFAQDEILPTSITSYTIVWYATLEDCIAQTNPITTCPHDGKVYASLTFTE